MTRSPSSSLIRLLPNMHKRGRTIGAVSDVTVRVPAKVNLGLSVGPAGEDGYHELVNVFHAVSIFDEVTASPAASITVAVEGRAQEDAHADVPLGEDNLAVRAARLLAAHAGVDDGVHLRIRKSIPVAGGMAGGSADAAAALVACDALWKTGLTRREMHELAATLGADVAFPLLGGTAVGRGRGERLAPVETERRLHWVFAPAEGGLSTAAVYAECDRSRAAAGVRAPEPRESEALMSALRTGDPAAVGVALHNDLEPAALSLRPELRRTLDAGLEAGAVGALVSGSGPTCAFLAGSEAHAGLLASALEKAGVSRPVRQAYGPVPGAEIVAAPEMPRRS